MAAERSRGQRMHHAAALLLRYAAPLSAAHATLASHKALLGAQVREPRRTPTHRGHHAVSDTNSHW